MEITRNWWNENIRPRFDLLSPAPLESDLIEFASKSLDEIYRLKEILCVVRECGVSDFNDTIVKLAVKALGPDFHISFSRFKEILDSL